MPPRPRCPSCGRLDPPSAFAAATIPRARLLALGPHIDDLRKLAVEFDAESVPENHFPPMLDLIDALDYTVKREGYEKPAGNPNQVGSKRRNAA